MRQGATLAAMMALAACADPKAPDTLAGQRLEVGDQRLIGFMPLLSDGPPLTVIGVRCEPKGFPIRLMELSRDQDLSQRELNFAVEFNRAMIGDVRYSAAECQPIGAPGEAFLTGAVEGQAMSAPFPPTYTFEQIFGFPSP